MHINRRKFLGYVATPILGTLLSGNSKQCASSEMGATLIIEQAKSSTLVNRQVMGVCLVNPPFNGLYNVANSVFSGTSVRLWASTLNHDWSTIRPILKQINPQTILVFTGNTKLDVKAIYHTDLINNLPKKHQTIEVVKRLKNVIELLDSAGLMPVDGVNWEVWNEPQYKRKGSWDPSDLARYATDCAKAIKQTNMNVRVGVPLNMDPSQTKWNEDLCSLLSTDLIDFFVTHYYSLGWNELINPSNDFMRRASGSEVLRKQVRNDVELIKRFGMGRWKLHCTEWNVHPVNYSAPYYSSTDMAAALYAFNAIKIYLEEGLDSAQIFQLASQASNHFSLYQKDLNSNWREMPTGSVMRLLTKYIHGKLVSNRVEGRTFQRDSQYGDTSTRESFVNAIVSEDEEGLSVVVANAHPNVSIRIKFRGVAPGIAYAFQLAGVPPKYELSKITKIKFDLMDGLDIAPASVTAFRCYR